MNEHITFEEQNDRLDGLLAPQRQAEVDAHLQACALCRYEYATLAKTVELMRSRPKVAIPEGVSFKIADYEARRRATSRRLLSAGGQLLAVATMAALLLLSSLSLVCGTGAFSTACRHPAVTALRLWGTGTAQPKAQVAEVPHPANTPSPGATAPTSGRPVITPTATSPASVTGAPATEQVLEMGGSGPPGYVETAMAALPATATATTTVTPTSTPTLTTTPSPTATAHSSPTASRPAMAAREDGGPANPSAAARPPAGAFLLVLLSAGVLVYSIWKMWQGRSPGPQNRSRFRPLI